MSPFEALYGRAPPNMLDYTHQQATLPELDLSLQKRQNVLNSLKENLRRTRLKMELQANKKRRDCSFQPGDLVLLRLQPYRQQTVRHRVSQKLSKRYFGPFPVLRRIGSLAYELKLPPSSRIHPVIHVSQLRPFYGSNPSAQFVPIPPELEACVNLDEENTDTSPHKEDSLSSHESTSPDLSLDSAAEPLTQKSHQTPHSDLPQDPTPQISSPASDPTTKPFIQSGPLDSNLEDKVSSGPDSDVSGLSHNRPKREKQMPLWTKDFILNSSHVSP